jgi:uncharacterized protein with PQ loop repeat
MLHRVRKLTHEQYVHTVDQMMSAASIIHPLTAAPQVYKIYSTQVVDGISILTWLGFMTLGLIFLAYGILHRIKPFIVTQILWFIVDLLVVIGVIIYS